MFLKSIGKFIQKQLKDVLVDHQAELKEFAIKETKRQIEELTKKITKKKL